MTPLDLALMFLEKGKQDEETLLLLAESPTSADEIFGFHVQQALEKYFKALLAVGEIRPPRTHELGILLAEVQELGKETPVGPEDVQPWSEYAVRNRYPMPEVLRPIDRSVAIALVGKVRAWVEEVLENGESP